MREWTSEQVQKYMPERDFNHNIWTHTPFISKSDSDGPWAEVAICEYVRLMWLFVHNTQNNWFIIPENWEVEHHGVYK